MSPVALIDAGGANLGSVRFALQRLGCEPRVVRDADGLRGAGKVILPGVGAAAPAMALLHERGLVAALRDPRVPVLGICLGMQLLYEFSEEGDVACLGLLAGRVARLPARDGCRTPHMGWNVLRPLAPSPLLAGVAASDQVYFVHGFAAPVNDHCVAAASHGVEFAAIARRGLACGMQFHPERSGHAGSRLLANFLAMEAA